MVPASPTAISVAFGCVASTFDYIISCQRFRRDTGQRRALELYVSSACHSTETKQGAATCHRSSAGEAAAWQVCSHAGVARRGGRAPGT
jgi:hypothetical protein